MESGLLRNDKNLGHPPSAPTPVSSPWGAGDGGEGVLYWGMKTGEGLEKARRTQMGILLMVEQPR
jgi:hypothetical protein